MELVKGMEELLRVEGKRLWKRWRGKRTSEEREVE